MATVYPAEPPRNGEIGEYAEHPDGPMRRIFADGDDNWRTEVIGGVQAEVWRTSDGFQVIRTNGTASSVTDFASWREAMIHGI